MNALSGSHCNYCSIRCMRVDRNNYLERKENASSLKRAHDQPQLTSTIASSSASLVQPSTSKAAASRNKQSPHKPWKALRFLQKSPSPQSNHFK